MGKVCCRLHLKGLLCPESPCLQHKSSRATVEEKNGGFPSPGPGGCLGAVTGAGSGKLSSSATSLVAMPR